LAQVLTPALDPLFVEHGAPVAFHGGIVRGEELSRDHALDLIVRRDPAERSYCGAVLAITRVVVGVFEPKRLNLWFARRLFQWSDRDPPMRFSVPFKSSGSSAHTVTGSLSVAGFLALIANPHAVRGTRAASAVQHPGNPLAIMSIDRWLPPCRDQSRSDPRAPVRVRLANPGGGVGSPTIVKTAGTAELEPCPSALLEPLNVLLQRGLARPPD
jgi:hypothetical protein